MEIMSQLANIIKVHNKSKKKKPIYFEIKS